MDLYSCPRLCAVAYSIVHKFAPREALSLALLQAKPLDSHPLIYFLSRSFSTCINYGRSVELKGCRETGMIKPSNSRLVDGCQDHPMSVKATMPRPSSILGLGMCVSIFTKSPSSPPQRHIVIAKTTPWQMSVFFYLYIPSIDWGNTKVLTLQPACMPKDFSKSRTMLWGN